MRRAAQGLGPEAAYSLYPTVCCCHVPKAPSCHIHGANGVRPFALKEYKSRLIVTVRPLLRCRLQDCPGGGAGARCRRHSSPRTNALRRFTTRGADQQVSHNCSHLSFPHTSSTLLFPYDSTAGRLSPHIFHTFLTPESVAGRPASTLRRCSSSIGTSTSAGLTHMITVIHPHTFPHFSHL